jgi:hypothetical protein
MDWGQRKPGEEDSDFAKWFGFMVGAGIRFFRRAAALRLTFRPPWVQDKASLKVRWWRIFQRPGFPGFLAFLSLLSVFVFYPLKKGMGEPQSNER